MCMGNIRWTEQVVNYQNVATEQIRTYIISLQTYNRSKSRKTPQQNYCLLKNIYINSGIKRTVDECQ